MSNTFSDISETFMLLGKIAIGCVCVVILASITIYILNYLDSVK